MITFMFFSVGIAVTVLLTIFTKLSYYFIPLWMLSGAIVAILVVFIFLVALLPIMKVTKKDLRLKYWILKGCAKFCNLTALGIDVDVIGKENIPKDGKLTIYANHKSQIDPFIIMSQINRPLAFTPKISIYKVPILAQYMDYVGCLPIDRADNRRTAKTMVQAIKQVENGHAMLIFPEGGIISRESEKMVDIKGGAYKIGMKAGSDYLPMSIIGASDYGKKKWYKRKRMQLIIHPVIKNEDVKDLNSNELGQLIFDVINSVIEE